MERVREEQRRARVVADAHDAHGRSERFVAADQNEWRRSEPRKRAHESSPFGWNARGSSRSRVVHRYAEQHAKLWSARGLHATHFFADVELEVGRHRLLGVEQDRSDRNDAASHPERAAQIGGGCERHPLEAFAQPPQHARDRGREHRALDFGEGRGERGVNDLT